jgi:hypothetical protein
VLSQSFVLARQIAATLLTRNADSGALRRDDVMKALEAAEAG